MKFRKKPIEVEAVQYNGPAWSSMAEAELFRWRDQYAKPGTLPIQARPGGGHILWIQKSSKWIDLLPGMWIIVESDGDGFYPCVSDIFAATYEPVEEQEQPKTPTSYPVPDELSETRAEDAYNQAQERVEAAGYDPMGLDGGDK